jgi:Na+-transporting methylmalonyl-CoA/oxaloacetate decarboxylase gamma subunit
LLVDWDLAATIVLTGLVLVFASLTLMIFLVQLTGKIAQALTPQKKTPEQTENG